ncbi:hypothetical protein BGE01nite_17000 [Brevifollis gellanilyticus]|uniref:Uncharacterized protein n=2 Tax=Brevifollis gellanilyticus TaxID=748831 RepID=A0A512M6P3_9BACT|nr:hypothetical protein BGE01nite_17000 [Brevifollis gellanilyticus]
MLETRAYNAMASYLVDHFPGDATAGQVLALVAEDGLIQEVGLVALCRGWPDSNRIADAIENLPRYIDGPEPVTAWLFALKANASLMADYIERYPAKLKKSYFGEARDGLQAINSRLQTDRDCRDLTLGKLQVVADLDTQITLAGLIAPAVQTDHVFREWISNQLLYLREDAGPLCQLARDTATNEVRPVKFALLEAALTT